MDLIQANEKFTTNSTIIEMQGLSRCLNPRYGVRPLSDTVPVSISDLDSQLGCASKSTQILIHTSMYPLSLKNKLYFSLIESKLY